jgi:hypothetical protein
MRSVRYKPANLSPKADKSREFPTPSVWLGSPLQWFRAFPHIESSAHFTSHWIAQVIEITVSISYLGSNV